MKIAFQGVRGAYSEAALLRYFGADVEAIGFPFSEQVFDAVESGRVDRGFVPVENSIAGSVGVNADLLLERKVFAVAESYHSIEHCLLGFPGTRLEDVKSVLSHPIALAQCRDFLKDRGLVAVPEYDTAGAAKLIAGRKTPGEAAIASRRCADVYDLIVLADNIQSAALNITRFLAFVREADIPEGLKREKTSFAFSVHHHPGALLECLKLFADHAINLTKLESRPIPSNPFEYSFFVDFLGGSDDVAVKAALAELGRCARRVKILGSYSIAERPRAGEMKRDGLLVPALYALICLIWGSTWLVIKIGLIGVPPFLGAGLRFTLASAVLFALIALRRTKIRLERDDQICILSCGLLSFALSYACVYWAEQYISSGLAAILYCMMPLVTALLSRFWTRSETLSGRKIGGILVAMAGTAVLFWPGEGVSRAELAGTAVALASVVCAAVNLVMVKRHGRNTDIYVMNALGMAIGAVLLLMLSAIVEAHAAVAWSRDNILAIVYLALAGSVTTFLSYYYLVKVMEATKLSLITLIFPIVAVALGRAFLHESLPASVWSGTAAVFIGVAIAIVPAPRRG